MREFFKGWKRKLGLLVAGAACLFLIAGIRSGDYMDGAEVISAATAKCSCFSTGGCLFLACEIRNQEGFASEYPVRYIIGAKRPKSFSSKLAQSDVTWRRGLSDIDFGASKRSDDSDVYACTIPYWLIVAPLTLSAYVLLRKSRQKPAKVPE